MASACMPRASATKGTGLPPAPLRTNTRIRLTSFTGGSHGFGNRAPVRDVLLHRGLQGSRLARARRYALAGQIVGHGLVGQYLVQSGVEALDDRRGGALREGNAVP